MRPSCHLSLQSIPRKKLSKTDTFKQGARMYMGATDDAICPIKAVVSYLMMTSNQPGPLFITKEGEGWTRAMFCTGFKDLLAKLNLNKHCYNTYSIRIRRSSNLRITSRNARHSYTNAWLVEK